MIERYYSQINILEYQEGSFGEPAKYTVKGTFKGLIQTPSNNQTFNNSKDTSSVSGILFWLLNKYFVFLKIFAHCKYLLLCFPDVSKK